MTKVTVWWVPFIHRIVQNFTRLNTSCEKSDTAWVRSSWVLRTFPNSGWVFDSSFWIRTKETIYAMETPPPLISSYILWNNIVDEMICPWYSLYSVVEQYLCFFRSEYIQDISYSRILVSPLQFRRFSLFLDELQISSKHNLKEKKKLSKIDV